MDLKDKTTQKNKHFFSSLFFALQGIKVAIKEERNMRIHLVIACLVIVFSFCLKVNKTEWLMLLIVIFLVLLMEIINTIFENIVDMFTEYSYHPLGKKIKDMGAAGVFLAAILAMIIGGIIFIPKIWQLIK